MLHKSAILILETRFCDFAQNDNHSSLHGVSRRRVETVLAGVPDMDVGAEAYRHVFTASAKSGATRRRRIEATTPEASTPQSPNMDIAPKF